MRRLATGSLPAAGVVVGLLAWSGTERIREGLLLHALGLALILTAIGLALKTRIHGVGKSRRTRTPVAFKAAQPALTVVAGTILGTLVTLTSIGAGALGTVMLVYLYPYRLTPSKLVGTDIAHAIPLALVAGVGHLALGNIDFGLLGTLLAGSIPGVLVGSMLSIRAPEAIVRHVIAIVLLFVGLKMLV